MDTLKRELIIKLLLTTPDNAVVCAPYLLAQGFSHSNLKQYVRRGHLDSLGRGAYCKHGHSPRLAAALEACTHQLKVPLHIGGWSALLYHGLLHFLPASERPTTIFTPTNTRLPVWLAQSFGKEYETRSTNIFPDGLSVSAAIIDGFSVPVSSPERAVLEYIMGVPREHLLNEAYQILEMLVNARSEVVQTLLEKCSSVKVKRLFLLLAEDLNYPWYEALDLGRIDLGSGGRVIDKGGKYRSKWLLTVNDWRAI